MAIGICFSFMMDLKQVKAGNKMMSLFPHLTTAFPVIAKNSG